uniref:Uncharacterized protein n=1 Tax=Eutreptiella gymnastica TaxID=73025 RepID=A0A7S1IJM3_9EUGL|mmetsp:Transcript_23380/g.42165  ORF Transcript_23380/g.42165 Transcript_23380/m.42165 type:complete len:106 (+) Transcript_23380:194-511(+)
MPQPAAWEHDECIVNGFFEADTDAEDELRCVSGASHSEPGKLDESAVSDNDVAPVPADHPGNNTTLSALHHQPPHKRKKQKGIPIVKSRRSGAKSCRVTAPRCTL